MDDKLQAIPDGDVKFVSLKAPEFSESSASGWFVILEAQFETSRVKVPSTQFFHAISHLPPGLISRLPQSVILSKDYDTLKGEVLNLVERSKPQMFDSLLNDIQITGRPSEKLTILKKTAERVGVADDFLRHRFIQSLPSSIAPALAAQTSLNLMELGKLADDLQCYSRNEGQISVVQKSKICDCHRSVQPFKTNQRPKICRAHIYYGSNARTCRIWCQYPDKKSCNIQPNSRPSSPSNLNSKCTQQR